MANDANLILRVRNVNRSPLDRKGRIEIRRRPDNKRVARVRNGNISAELKYKLAVPGGTRLFYRIKSEGYRATQTVPFSFFSDGDAVEHAARVLRRPKFWNPNFDAWELLAPRFGPLKTLLKNSNGVFLKRPRGQDGFDLIGNLSGHAYDNVAREHPKFAKAALLNLYKMTRRVKNPFKKSESWFSFLREIIVVDRERIVARVDPRMIKVVRRVLRNPAPFGYEEEGFTFAKGHASNLPPGYTYDPSPKTLHSAKSDNSVGNLQVTVFEGVTNESGKRIAVADIDIDENGDLFAHIADVIFRHPKTGGTNPLDIYEIEMDRDGKTHPGYHLERK